jgi:hypothetical protein
MSIAAYPGWPVRLENLVGDVVIAFPTYAMEWETGGELRSSFADVPLDDYSFDLLGIRPSPRAASGESIRFVILGQNAQDVWRQYSDMRGKLARIGRGRLWVRDAVGTQYWCYVRPLNLATTTLGVENLRHLPVTLSFKRLSDWLAAAASSATFPGNGTHTLVVNGNVAVLDFTVEIVATATNGYASPTIVNATTGEQFTIARTAASNQHRLRVLTASWRAQESSNGGNSWIDVTASLTVPQLQPVVLRLMPGNNLLQVSGCPSANVLFSWYDAYA